MPEQFQNPYGNVEQLQTQYNAAQSQYDPMAQYAYEMAKLDYQGQQQQYKQNQGGGLLGMLFSFLNEEPDNRTVSSAMSGYFQELEDQRSAQLIQKQLTKAQGFRDEVAGASIKDRQKMQVKLEMLQGLNLTPEQYQAAATNALGGGSGVTVNNSDQKRPGYWFGQEVEKRQATTYAEWQKDAIQAQESNRTIGSVMPILQEMATGVTPELLAKVGQVFGTEAGADAQSAFGVIGRLAMEELNKMKGPATEKEFERIVAQLPGVGKDPRANLTIANFITEMNDRAIGRFGQATDFAQANNGLFGFTPSYEGSIYGGAPKFEAKGGAVDYGTMSDEELQAELARQGG